MRFQNGRNIQIIQRSLEHAPVNNSLKELLWCAWAPAAVVVTHAVFAAAFGHQLWLDPILHFLGGAAALYSCNRFLQKALALQYKPATPMLMVASIVLLWEVGEFLSDTFLHTNVQRGFLDTGVDMILGLLGAALCFYLIHRKDKAAATLLT